MTGYRRRGAMMEHFEFPTAEAVRPSVSCRSSLEGPSERLDSSPDRVARFSGSLDSRSPQDLDLTCQRREALGSETPDRVVRNCPGHGEFERRRLTLEDSDEDGVSVGSGEHLSEKQVGTP
jgi:hypothetical protein